MESIYLYICLFVSLSAYLFTNRCLYRRRWGDGGAVTFDVKGDIDEYRGGEGQRQETWDFVVTAMVLTLGDTGTTWHYTLTAKREREREDERRDGEERKNISVT